MRRFNVLQAIPLSFFSKALYQDVARRWSGAAVGYLLLTLFVFWAPRAVRLHVETARFCKVRAPGVLKQIPPFRITNGHLLIDAPQPVMIRDPQNGGLLAVIDTTGQFTSPRQSGAHVLLTGHSLMVERSSGLETRNYEFPPKLDFSYQQSKGFEWLARIGAWFATTVSVIGLVCFWLSALLKVLIFATLGLALLRNRGSTLPFEAAFRLAAVALTPALFYDLLIAWPRHEPPLAWIPGFLISLGYLWFAVQAAAEPEPGVAAASPSAPSPPPVTPQPVH